MMVRNSRNLILQICIEIFIYVVFTNCRSKDFFAVEIFDRCFSQQFWLWVLGLIVRNAPKQWRQSEDEADACGYAPATDENMSLNVLVNLLFQILLKFCKEPFRNKHPGFPCAKFRFLVRFHINIFKFRMCSTSEVKEDKEDKEDKDNSCIVCFLWEVKGDKEDKGDKDNSCIVCFLLRR